MFKSALWGLAFKPKETEIERSSGKPSNGLEPLIYFMITKRIIVMIQECQSKPIAHLL